MLTSLVDVLPFFSKSFLGLCVNECRMKNLNLLHVGTGLAHRTEMRTSFPARGLTVTHMIEKHVKKSIAMVVGRGAKTPSRWILQSDLASSFL